MKGQTKAQMKGQMTKHSDLIHSTLLHALFGLLILLATLVEPTSNIRKVAKFTVIEKERVIENFKKIPENKPIAIKQQRKETAKPRKVKQKSVKPVFGISNKAITSDSSRPSVKTGNTVAKAPDKEILTDTTPLPEPTEEYLVTDMPELLSESLIDYPPSAREEGVEGTVVLQILIDKEGQVVKSELISGPDERLNSAALEAIKRFKFKPAMVGDTAVAISVRYSYRFVLEN